MDFQGKQKTFKCTQLNHGPIEEVFPLLCPVREKDWIKGWDFNMIHSKSGLIEEDCVFTTSHHGEKETVWQVTQYDPVGYNLEFIRVTPDENMVRINIHLDKVDSCTTRVFINYMYTALNEEQNRILGEEMEENFNNTMRYWEKAINHYLKTGMMLIA